MKMFMFSIVSVTVRYEPSQTDGLPELSANVAAARQAIRNTKGFGRQRLLAIGASVGLETATNP